MVIYGAPSSDGGRRARRELALVRELRTTEDKPKARKIYTGVCPGFCLKIISADRFLSNYQSVDRFLSKIIFEPTVLSVQPVVYKFHFRLVDIAGG